MDTQNINNQNSENSNINEKQEKPLGILLCVILSTVVLLYISLFTVFPIANLAGIIALAVFCGSYGVLLKKANFVLCLIAPGLSVASVFFVAGSKGKLGAVAFACCINLFFAVLLSALLNGCTVKKSSGGTTFVALSLTSAVYIAALLLFAVFQMYGSIGPDAVHNAINETAELVGKMFSEVSVPAENTDIAKEYKEALKELGKTMQTFFKLTFPTMISTAAMLVSAFIYILYKPFVKLAGLEKDCFEGRVWRFEISSVGAILFEVVFLIYIILSFFSQNTVLNVAFMNLVSVLTVPFAYIGLRHLAGLLKNKLGSRIGAAAIVAVSSVCIMMFLGASVFVLAALIGASSITKKKLEDTDK